MIESRSFELSGRDVHVWTLRIGTSDALYAKFISLLAANERERADRYRFDHLRQSFAITHGVLRCLLGRYVGLPAASVQFNYGSKGKPALFPARNIEFNMAHSHGLAVFAFTRGCPIGVDVEQIHPLPEMQDIASRFFCPEEAAEISSLPVNEHERAFFSCWTRKEAYLKATGDGLSTPLDQFRVTLKPTEPAKFVHFRQDTREAEKWTLHDLRLTSGYAAALAYRDRPRRLQVFPTIDSAEFMRLP